VHDHRFFLRALTGSDIGIGDSFMDGNWTPPDYHYDGYFEAVDRLLAPDGATLLQTITVDDQWFPNYHGTPDWIEKTREFAPQGRDSDP
jgi:hypothetical protein